MHKTKHSKHNNTHIKHNKTTNKTKTDETTTHDKTTETENDKCALSCVSEARHSKFQNRAWSLTWESRVINKTTAKTPATATKLLLLLDTPP